MRNKIKLTGILLLFGFSTPGVTADEARHNDGAIPFPQEIKALITQEMQALQQGMHEIISAIASGNWSQLEKSGKQMRDSYIMKQKLTKEQKEALHATLPETFKQLDQAFHHSAGMLSQAAERRNMEQVLFHYSKITTACVNCHSQHARHRFPALAATPQVRESTTMSECSSMNQLMVALTGGDISSKCGSSSDEANTEEEY